MVFDRISLIKIYDTLKIVQDNDGPVSNILMNKTSQYGTKTIPRFRTLADLKVFIEEKYPFQIWNPDCDCATENEGIYNILAFTVYIDDKKHAIFVNNMRASFESQKTEQLNAISVKKVHELFKVDGLLKDLFLNYVCFPYIQVPGDYTDPCDYIEIIKNIAYKTLINTYYRATKRLDFPKTKVK
jgi:hypothetical protein